jgi:hypothetical protein
MKRKSNGMKRSVFMWTMFIVCAMCGCSLMKSPNDSVLYRFDFHEGFNGESVSAFVNDEMMFSDKILVSDKSTDVAFSLERSIEGPMLKLRVVVDGKAFSFTIKKSNGKFLRIYSEGNAIHFEQSHDEFYYD